MTYKVAKGLNESLTLDADYTIRCGERGILEDPLCKGYVYANLFFYDEAQKEILKLRQMVEKIYDEVLMELGLDPNEPEKLLLEISARATRMIGDDGLEYLIKDFLAEKSSHLSLIADERETANFAKICEAIFVELLQSFFATTMQNAVVSEDGIKSFRFSQAYINALTERQKNLVAPTLRVIGLENKIKLNQLRIGDDWTVKYIPTPTETSFVTQEEAIKDNLKDFIRRNS